MKCEFCRSSATLTFAGGAVCFECLGRIARLVLESDRSVVAEIWAVRPTPAGRFAPKHVTQPAWSRENASDAAALHAKYARDVAALGMFDDAVLESAIAVRMSHPSPEMGMAAATLLSPNAMQPSGAHRLREILGASGPGP